jgi:hypothetical protein
MKAEVGGKRLEDRAGALKVRGRRTGSSSLKAKGRTSSEAYLKQSVPPTGYRGQKEWKTEG